MARFALSCIVLIDKIRVRQHPVVCCFLKGAVELKTRQLYLARVAQSTAILVSLGALRSLRLTYLELGVNFAEGGNRSARKKTLEVRLRLTETQSTYNIVVEVEGVIDVHYASMTSQ